jgi:hypothetical protein
VIRNRQGRKKRQEAGGNKLGFALLWLTPLDSRGDYHREGRKCAFIRPANFFRAMLLAFGRELERLLKD